MAKQIAVEKIVIQIGSKKLELTPEEMKELRDILDATFPKKSQGNTIIIDRPVYPWRWTHWMEPKWVESDKPQKYQTMCLTANRA